ncbi:lamin tail domain-containing protein [Stieleria sp. TO1_6]|uniref:lamin tail domain-containing protein n=1 Tax=Stieleria tagensis TaxID=2956795 RepID=UPI00209B2437|nr:lamin tail domain-containing protein [Stieleria tagensis]MCO8124654.1 lamin tail domain-containing protein [Stieleria tagensis]
MAATPVISEFLASNSGGLDDIDGDSSDWIEIYNPTSQAIDLGGWSLTDDATDLTQWSFPATPLAPSESLVVFASGKDLAVSGQQLHTNFKLSSDGEYLALVDSSGVVASEFAPQYPSQSSNVSYGFEYVAEPLVGLQSAVAVSVPTDASLGDSWQQVGFNDSGWIDATNGVGFGIVQPGFDIRYVKAKSFETFDGSVTSLAIAESVLANPDYQSISVTERSSVINLLGTGAGGNYGNDLAFPTQSVGDDINHFVIEATATIDVPSAGQWSFGVNSDDGFGLVLSRGGVDYASSFPGTRGAQNTIETFDLPAAGEYDVRLVMFEAAGGAGVEFFAAPGNEASFSSAFDLVGDTAAGGLTAFTPYVAGQNPLVNTDIESEMATVNSSAYLRFPFQVADAATVESLTLQIRHDDGFVAYLNGVEIARRNAPASVGFDAAATASRDPSDVLQVVEIPLDATAIAAIQDGDNLLAIQGLNASAADDSFLISAELLNTRLVSPTPTYFSTPTPGQLNQDPVLGVLQRVTADLPAGFYDTAQSVTLNSSDTVAQIVYTTDGSQPSETNGIVYSGPIAITGTTTLRAIAVADDYVSLPSITRTYLFLDDVLNQSNNGDAPPGWPASWGQNAVDYGIDPDVISAEGAEQVKAALLAAPTLSLTTDLENLFDPVIGIYANAQQDGRDWERPTSAEWLNPDGSEGFQVNAGLRIRGGYSRRSANAKHSFKLFFRGSYGDSSLDYPVHGDTGVSEFQKLDLRTPQNYSWSGSGDASNNFIAEVLARQNQRDLGQPYTRSTWIHLYLNGQYWGLYQTQERADANYAESYFGGQAGDYDVLKPERGDYRNIATDGNFDAYEQLWSQANARAADGVTPAFVDDAAYLQAQGKNPDGSDNLNYPVLLDVDNLITYMIETLRGGNLDAPISNFLGNDQPNNYFAIRDRTGREGFRFFQHDAEHTMRNVNENRNGPWNAANYEIGVDFFNPQWLHQQLMANEEYRIRFADTVQSAFFNDGPLSTAALIQKVNDEAAKIETAVIAESARWGDARRGENSPRGQADFLNAIAGLKNNYLPNRNQILLDQFRNTTLVLKDTAGDYNVVVPAPLFPNIDAPSFLIDGSQQHGGQITDTSSLRFDSPDGLVYYTIDGSDPRDVGGGIQSSALVYDPQQVDQLLVQSGAEWNYLDDGSQPPSNWISAAFDDTAWASGPAELGYGDGDEATVISFGSDSSNKHLTSYFRHEFNADLTAGSLVSATLRVRRDDGVAVYLNGVEIVRDNLPSGPLSSTTLASSVVGGASESQWFEFAIDPALMLQGTNVIAAEVHQISANSSDLTFDAEVLLSTQSAASIPLTDTTQVTARTLDAGGQWSAKNQALFQILNVPASPANLRLSEINYDPALDGDAEYLELRNITSGSSAVTIDLDGVTITDGPSAPFTIPLGTKLGPGESALLVHDQVIFTSTYPGVDPSRIVGQYEGKLSNSGERIRVVDASGNEIADVTYDVDDPWPQWADGVGGSLVLVDPALVPVAETGKPYHYIGSVEFGGSPGAVGQSPFGIVVNEVLAHTDEPLSDAIELYNPTDQPLGIGGWFLSDDGSEPEKYKIPAGTTIAAGEYIVFDESDFNPSSANGNSLVPFALSAAKGDSVWLFSGSGGSATGLEDQVQFDATFNGVSVGRIVGSGGRLVPLANRSLGLINGTFKTAPVVISEIQYHPTDPTADELLNDPTLTAQDFEFIEIQNAAGSVMDLTQWRLRGESDFDFADGETLAVGEALVVVSFDPVDAANATKLTAFRDRYGIGAGVRLVGPFSGSLNNSHGIVKLQDHDDPPTDDPTVTPRVTVDEVFYDDLAPWPVAADGQGPSLQRIAASTLGNYHDSWVAETPTPGGIPLRPVVESVQVNNALPGRSSVTQITVNFDQQVDVSADSFVVQDRDSGDSVGNLQVSSQIIGGKTVAQITFGSSPLVISRPVGGNSLVDGAYQLTVVAAKVTSSDSGTVMAFDHSFGDSEADQFFRLFGDHDGDRDVDGQDLGQFGLAFLSHSADANYDGDLDYDGDGDIDSQDYGQFSRRYLRRLNHNA